MADKERKDKVESSVISDRIELFIRTSKNRSKIPFKPEIPQKNVQTLLPLCYSLCRITLLAFMDLKCKFYSKMTE